MPSIKQPGKIIVVGSSNTDMVVRAPRLPKPGETVLGDRFLMVPGGKGANQALAARRALDPWSGGEVVLIARIGDDAFGRSALESLRQEGVAVDSVIVDPLSPSGVALIIVDGRGENMIAVAPGANSRLSPADIEQARDRITSASVLLAQLEIPIESVHAAAEIASSAGAKVIINPAPAQPILHGDLLSHVSIMTPNETETEILTGIRILTDKDLEDAADCLLSIGLEAAFITLGSRGVYVATSGFKELIPAFSVESIDATGAGDVFNAGLAVALSEGKSLPEAALFANAAAALSVTRTGARAAVPRRVEIENLLRRSRH
ncbi:MAG: ribokinase [Candidatus Aminicenantales bacterium]